MVDGGLGRCAATPPSPSACSRVTLNLDCNVDVLDDQAIAFRYGSSLGLLLYDPFYDLDPKVADNDIDIKDLQFVFGRNGSTCATDTRRPGPLPASTIGRLESG